MYNQCGEVKVQSSTKIGFSLVKKLRKNIETYFLLKAVCCVFQPAFGCCVHPKAGRNIFFILVDKSHKFGLRQSVNLDGWKKRKREGERNFFKIKQSFCLS